MSLFGSDALDAQSLGALLEHELKDIYDAEFQILEALPKMIEAANEPELKKAFRDHMAQTQMHVSRLEQCFKSMQIEPARITCDGMKGVIKEGAHVLKGEMDPAVKDDALIGAAQRVEHYEMASYGAARAHAKHLHLNDVVELLDTTLSEEGDADKLLTKIAITMHKHLAKAEAMAV